MFDRFTSAAAEHFERPVPELDNRLLQVLLSHAWPGNIRELKSAAKRFVLGFPLLGAELIEENAPANGLKTQLRVIEKILIQEALKRHKHCVDAVSQEFEIPRRTLYHRMKELDV